MYVKIRDGTRGARGEGGAEGALAPRNLGGQRRQLVRRKIFAITMHIPGYQAGCYNILIFGTVPL